MPPIQIRHSDRAARAKVLVGIALLGFGENSVAGRSNLAQFQSASASDENGDYAAAFAVDGIVSNFHSFRSSNTSDPHWLQVTFPRPLTVGSAHLYLGLDNGAAKGLAHFKIQFRDGGGTWVDIPGTEIFGNTATELVVPFPTAQTADRFRLYTDDNGNRIVREIALSPPNLVGGNDAG